MLKARDSAAEVKTVAIAPSVRFAAPQDLGVTAALAPGAIRMAAQPILRSSDLAVAGQEALARFLLEPSQPPDWWLRAAEGVGLRPELELACLKAALELGDPPEGQLLFVNLSPSLLESPGIAEVLGHLPERLVLEISECEAVEDYGHLRSLLAPLLERGVRIAIDDTGAGYSSLRHVVELAPDFLKLDRELVRGLDSDPTRMALVRAVVSFAREVGTHVIGEGVETRGELEALRDAGVHFLQGYLLGRPAFGWGRGPWPDPAGEGTEWLRSQMVGLTRRLEECQDVRSACAAVADFLFRRGSVMPSIYLERGGSLRCTAQRGLWQVLDGMSASTGITGRCWATGSRIIVDEVAQVSDYLEAIPGVRSEVCFPIRRGDSVVGALNVESFAPFAPSLVTLVEGCAAVLGNRLALLSPGRTEATWEGVTAASLTMSGLRPGPGLSRRVLGCLMRASRFDSGAIIMQRPGRRVIAAEGRLADRLDNLTHQECDGLAALVEQVRSCYTAGDPTDYCFVGTDSLREAGVRALIVLPLWARKERIGAVVLASTTPRLVDTPQVEPLEVLADHAASLLVDLDGSRNQY
jgi:EAL domain-containing protein (putative c-di-GMP-specific phosphodiesterase class I)/putative methionine-R-sulfoxide reductase with GAF domain